MIYCAYSVRQMLRWSVWVWVSMVALGGCASKPPKNTNDVCAIFDEKKSWYKQALRASQRWDIPVAVNMAFMHQESRFVAKAKPPRTRILWLFPGPRKSDAYGYSQAKKTTCEWYVKSSGRRWADRDDFDDAIDFIAWYNSVTRSKFGLKPNDAMRLYLAYHEGHGGYQRGSYRKKQWLINVAKKVEAQRKKYQIQLNRCKNRGR